MLKKCVQRQSSPKPGSGKSDNKTKMSQLYHALDFARTEGCLSHVSKAACKFVLLEQFRVTKAQVLFQGNGVDGLRFMLGNSGCTSHAGCFKRKCTECPALQHLCYLQSYLHK